MRHIDHWRTQLMSAQVGNEPGVLAVHTIENGMYGALGVHAPIELGTFAVLTPWIVVPTITEATLFVADLEDRLVTICRLSESVAGVTEDWTQASWGVDDDGSVMVGEPVPGMSPNDAISFAVMAAISARRDGAYWSEGLVFDNAAMISRHLMDTYLR